ncbi:MAG: tRNA preQ1(34) S-adenosylmethionine ribosyltransferase-isomerase QueA [Myxococcales bacterium]|nr:tRNA preQ1(34) S-adenosylmethionine ribosyltransferase-isomerase QueA [Myxococcales bacterium]
MKTELFDYALPESQIAFHPPAQRDGGRLMVLYPTAQRWEHARIQDLPAYLPAQSLLVFNATRVIPARLHAQRDTGGRVEVLFVRCAASDADSSAWVALCRANRPLRPGARISLGPGIWGEVDERRARGEVRLRVNARRDAVLQLLQRSGEIPLPPYIRRPPDSDDAERYQTVFAAHDGSVAAPTAGLHFTPELLAEISGAGHDTAHVTLHVGPGTFRPITADDLGAHEMDEEFFVIGEAAAQRIAAARQAQHPVLAVGTTTVRTLEGAVAAWGALRSGTGSTRIFIAPPHRFQVVDALLTNFHLPRSTLLCLVSAMAGREFVLAAYREAVDAGYRFYSYGDAMLILP